MPQPTVLILALGSMLTLTMALPSESTHSESEIASLFAAFKQTYSKTYSGPAEEARRLETFQANVAFINEHNALFAKGLKTFDLGVNAFADLTR